MARPLERTRRDTIVVNLISDSSQQSHHLAQMGARSMRWEPIYERLTADGYVEFVQDTGTKPYIMRCLNSHECGGPTFFHFFLRDLDLKLVARCASCDVVQVLAASSEEVEPEEAVS